jgi:hypothetical protein
MHKYSEVEIKTLLKIFIDNTSVVVGDHVRILMGTNNAPFLADHHLF